MTWSFFDANGALETSVPAIAATAITGQVAPNQGGTGLDTSASTGVLVVASGTWSTKTNPSGAFVGTTDSQDLSNKTLQDSTVSIVDNSDPTKVLKFQVSPITAGQTRTLTVVDRDDTIATLGGNEAFTGAKDYSGATLRVPVSAGGAVTTTEGYWQWDSTNKLFKWYDGTRERGMAWGYQAWAAQIGFNQSSSFSTASNTLAANGGTMLIPVVLAAHMLLQSVTVQNNDTTLQRIWGWDLYVDIDNANNSVQRVATGTSNETFTATAASARTINASVTPTYLPPGAYWLAIQNRHPSNTFALGIQAAGLTSPPSTGKTKTTTNANGSTLDIITATWTAIGATISGVLRGRVAADTVAW